MIQGVFTVSLYRPQFQNGLERFTFSKELSANTFNDYWNNNIKPEIKEPAVQPKISTSNDADLPAEEPHHLFDF
jgi:hypothetical protein